ncbi:Pyruvate/2-oxoglutarate dehydrogenase complex, dihydrolipoamide dehydrogenase (E3) component [Amycolatopsis arida]|uniref:Pyruvate/2-oxoglutarate dehydrogenase complex, dihydrolipoamide dehydrogenase (E3) component n=1 Tax=Amycolatopsis arida TaxID=587909 RepID=A0A1I6ARS8_9PSEU|nr:FAD-dependent oxidoreductase [Amycolatopsis arida]TDX97574.1 pyruvate/2-oxoglutarate dehydrogenase complex dihydrolipoamide dehydrogenase (E3) component [Amycolatopsis arida]SFQ71421.1 Pyruvate/2-oxoglutarate dehydrogenase complex, dihydrolipoamide dehydrogenase (E3) component [Amycolatopsis arida]
MTRRVPDLLVIGGGTAGILAARTAAGLGARVVLVERDRTGGDCLWTGCVPSKALLAAAGTAHRMSTSGRFGIAPVEPVVDFAAVLAHVRAAIDRIAPADSPAALADSGVEVLRGEATFVGPREARVGERALPFRRSVVATGSSPALPPVPGLAGIDPLTSDTVWDLTELPRRLVVVGGGPVGCELGQAFARLGTEVTIVEAAERLLPNEEPFVGEALAAALAAEGVRVLTSTTLTAAAPAAGGVRLDTAGPDPLRADRVLVATGRRPGTAGLDLPSAGVRTGERGHVVVDDRLRTSNPRVLAAGDVTGRLPFTHVAGVHGSVAATNALLGPLRRVDHERIPWVTFTDPEVARVGLTEAQARARHGDRVRVRRVDHADVDRAVTEDATRGSTHVVLDGRGRVLGATVVAPRAGEVIAELTGVLARGGRLRDLAGVTHPYPTWSDGVWSAAVAEATSALRTPVARRLGRLLLWWRRHG